MRILHSLFFLLTATTATTTASSVSAFASPTTIRFVKGFAGDAAPSAVSGWTISRCTAADGRGRGRRYSLLLSSKIPSNEDDAEFDHSSSLKMMPPSSPSSSSSSSSSSSPPPSAGWTTALTVLTTTQAIMMMTTTLPAAAAGPDWGIFEGKTGSLLHPLIMGGLLAFSLSTALLGFDWRRLRTIGDDISALKRQLPTLPEGVTSIKAAIDVANAAETKDPVYIASLQQGLELEQSIQALQDERKQLSQKAPRDKHFSQGAWLAFVGTAFAIEGPLNTYARAGKLFPGPHLYAGAGLVVLWALASACVPSMIKGNDTARTVHIGANVAGIALFAWQLTTGIPILQKVWENTTWP